MSVLAAIARELPPVPDATQAPKPASASALAMGANPPEMDVAVSEPDRRIRSARQPQVQKPVLQFAPVPMTLDTKHFENALSNENPDGDSRSLRAFRDLVDPLPGFSGYYSGRGSTEAVYTSIVHGAHAREGAGFAQQVIADCRKRLKEQMFANLDGTVGVWGPVYASPGDWADNTDPARFRELEIDLSGDGSGSSPYASIGGEPRLELHAGSDGANAGVALDKETHLKTLRMKYMLVTLRRPWMNRTLFEIDGWELRGQLPGFCSSGSLDDNRGTMPLVPTAVLLGKDITLDADWSPATRAYIDRNTLEGLSLGPIPLAPRPNGSSLQVIAWISALTPFSPENTNLGPGSLRVDNKGNFAARISMSWKQDGETKSMTSGIITEANADRVDIPAAAREIRVMVEIMTMPWPQKWKTIKVFRWNYPGDKLLKLSGTITNPSAADLS